MPGMSGPRRETRSAAAGRGAGFWLGLVLVLLGLALLGWVGWQLVGTNVVAHRAQQQVVSELQQRWRTAGREPAGTPGDTATAAPLPGDAIALVRIPRFGDDFVVPVLEGVGDHELERGLGHFPGTAEPGARGNFALAGHRITHGEPLRDMPDLRPGDLVLVETQRRVYRYRLDTDPRELVVELDEDWVLDPVPTNPRPGGVEPAQRPGQRLLTLTTCAELFHTDTRMIAFGHLVGAAPRSEGVQ
jgi:sortase A